MGQESNGGESSRAAVTRFVIIAAPRTGSNWVCGMLNSHPEILCHHEIFNPEGVHYALDHRGGDLDLGTKQERDAAPLDFVERLWLHTFGKRVVGFKINRGQSEAVFRSLLSDRRVLKVVLVRRNRVKTFVSELIAERTGRWESYGPPPPGGEPDDKLVLDAAALREHAALNADYYARVRRALGETGQEYLQATYEELKSEGEWRRILKFLGVAPDVSALSPATRKQNPNDLRDLLSNYAQAEAALAGSEFEAELRADVSRDDCGDK